MIKFNKNFFENNEILFFGATKKYKMFCNSAYKALSGRGIKIYPLCDEADIFSFKVYKDFNELPVIPKTAYTILDTDDNRKIINQLKERGIKRILFHSKRIIDQDILDRCAELGIETAIACPLMIYGSALHRVHGFFAGVR